MRAIRVGMTAAVLLAGLAASSASAQEIDGDLHSAAPKPKAWWDGWFTPAAKPVEKHTEAAPVPAGPTPLELATAVRQREKAVYFRRMDVCLRLNAVAVQNNDEAMQAQIEQLRERAWDLFQQRISAMPAGSNSQDEAALDRKPGLLSAGRPLDKAGKDAGQTSLLREVKP